MPQNREPLASWIPVDGPPTGELSGASRHLDRLEGPPYRPGRPSCRQIDICSDGQHLLAVWGDQLSVLSCHDGSRAAADLCPDAGLKGAHFFADGSRVLLTTRDERALRLHWPSGRIEASSPPLGDEVELVAWCEAGAEEADHTALLLTAAGHLLRLSAEQLERTQHVASPAPDAPFQRPTGLAVSPDGHRAFVCSEHQVRCVDLDSGEQLWLLQQERPVLSCALSPEGARLALADLHGIRLLDSATGVEITREDCFVFQGMTWHGAPAAGVSWVPRLAFSTDGPWLAASTPNGEVLTLDPVTLERQQQVDRPRAQGFAQDIGWLGQQLAVGCADDAVALWDLSPPGCRCVMQAWLSSGSRCTA